MERNALLITSQLVRYWSHFEENMTLRRRMLFFLGFTLALILFTVLFFDVYLANKYFADFEQRVGKRDLAWANKLIVHEEEHLVAFLRDWSSRESLRDYLKNSNPDFIEQNLAHRNFAIANIHYLAILDSNRKVLYSRGYDYKKKQRIEFSTLSPEWYEKNEFLWSQKYDSLSGLLEVPEGILLYAVHPIHASDDDETITGLLVVGRLVDSTMFNRLSRELEIRISLTPLSLLNADLKQKAAKNERWFMEVPGRVLSRPELACYSVVNDFYDHPAFLLQARIQRDLKPFINAEVLDVIVKIVAILSLLIFFWWIISKTLVNRIENLSGQVTLIGNRADINRRTKIGGSDELSDLSENINSMLDNLHRSRETLRESDRRFREILSNIRLIGYVLDSDGRILFCNKFMQEVTGWSESELLHSNWFDRLVPEPTRNKRWQEYRNEIQRNRLDPQELRDIITKQGERRTILFNITAMRDREGKVVGAAVIGEDITDRILAEAEIRRLATLVESATESIEITDSHTNLIYVNPAFTRIMGYGAPEVLGKPIAILNSEKQSQEHFEEIWSTVSVGGIWSGHLLCNSKDGRMVELDATILPLRDPGGNITHFGKFARDVTQQTELQNQLNRAQRFVAVGELTGGIAHNFNNVLTVIMGNIGLAKISEPNRIKECLAEAESACLRASDLIKQLMTFSRRTQIEKKPVQVEKLLQEIVTLVRSTFDRRFEIELDEIDVKHNINGDSSQLHQVLLNMCFNAKDALNTVALDHNHPLKITLSAREVNFEEELIDAELRSGNYICVVVSDTGCGMAHDVARHIFEPFYTTKAVGQGTGLGLSTAFGIVKQHEGWITVSSAPNIGTTFMIYLPAMSKDISEHIHDQTDGTIPRGNESIILVEDEDLVRRVGQQLLERQGYRVTIATNGQEALDLLAENEGGYDLIILDVSMPVMTGFEFLDQLIELKKNYRVLLSSGVPIGELKPEYSGIVVGNIPKPYHPEQLLIMIRKALDSGKSDDNGGSRNRA